MLAYAALATLLNKSRSATPIPAASTVATVVHIMLARQYWQHTNVNSVMVRQDAGLNVTKVMELTFHKS
jgi:hypothetical protein